MANHQSYLIMLLALWLFVFVKFAAPLRCYACSSKDDGKNCTDPIANNLPSSTCDLPTAKCLKQILPAFGRHLESLHRGCVDESYCTNYEKTSTHCSLCNSDECNAALTNSPPLHIAALSLTMCFVYNNLMR